jgi:hypothetical protein
MKHATFTINKQTSPQGMKEIFLQYLERERIGAVGRETSSLTMREARAAAGARQQLEQMIEFWKEVEFVE